MGIHIIATIIGKRLTEEVHGYEEKCLEYERYNSFDSIRRTGDSDFIFNEDIEWEYKFDDPENPDHETSYRRPKDIDKAKDWVQKNVPDSNKDRLINLLNDMAQNKNLWITVSY